MTLAALIAFFQTPLGKAIFSLVLNALVKSGAIDAAEKLAVKMLWVVVTDVEGLKSFHAPDDFPHVERQAVTTNLTTKDGTRVG